MLQTCGGNRKQQATIPTYDLVVAGNSVIAVVHVSTLPVFELISGVQASLCQVTSENPVYPDYASDISDVALLYGSSFLPVLFCC